MPQLKPLSEVLKKKLENPSFARAFEEEKAKVFLAYAIKELRQKQSLTQKQLAAMVGTDQSSVAKIERALAFPKMDLLSRLVTALGGHLIVEITVPEPIGEPPKKQILSQGPHHHKKVPHSYSYAIA